MPQSNQALALLLEAPHEDLASLKNWQAAVRPDEAK